MKRAVLILFSFLISINLGVAQMAGDWNEGLWMTQDAPGIFTVRWFGKLGRTYFVQQSLDLTTWIYRTDIEPGLNLVIPYGVQTNSERYYLRLNWTEALTDDPANSDFDGDGLSNANELARGLDPLTPASVRDSDGDGLPDDWERFWFNGSLSHGGSEPGGDGFTMLEKFQFGLNPTISESVSSAKDLSYDALALTAQFLSILFA